VGALAERVLGVRPPLGRPPHHLRVQLCVQQLANTALYEIGTRLTGGHGGDICILLRGHVVHRSGTCLHKGMTDLKTAV
jgi:hypothetical protein